MRASRLLVFLLGPALLHTAGCRPCPDSQYLGDDGLCYSPGEADEDDDGGGDAGSETTPVEDADGDGWSVSAGDCDDHNPDVYPGAPDDSEDGVDNDCDDIVDEDFHGEVDSVEYPDGGDGSDWSDECDEASESLGDVPFDPPVEIPVKVVFVREDDGSGEAVQADVEEALERANDYFDSIGISFAMTEVEEINDTDLTYADDDDFDALQEMYPTDDTLHFFVVLDGEGFSGKATYAGVSNPAIMVDEDYLSSDRTTTVHELGHYFGLRHTHHDTDDGDDPELVDGSNCAVSGDRTCDTPADPGPDWHTPTGEGCDEDSCDLTCGQDSNGDTYEPNVGDIMSYYSDACNSDTFSDGQLLRMVCHARRTHENLTGTSSTTINLDPNNPSVTDSTPDAGDTITVSGTINNDGTGSSGSFGAGLYLSTDSTWSSGDTELASWTQSSISASGSGSYSESVTIPSSASGSYYIIVVTDPDDDLAESDETDNTGYRSISVTAAATTINLDPNNPSVTDSTPDAGDTITVSGTINNDGTGSSGSFGAGLYLSTDSTWSSGDTELASWTQSSISASGSGSYSESVTIPSSASGSYYIIVVTDPDDDLAESDESDNTGYRSISVTASVNLDPGSVSVSDTSPDAGDAVTVSGSIDNDGSSSSGSFTAGIYLSTDSAYSSADTTLTTWTQSSISGGGSGSYSKSVSIHSSASGSYYILVVADPADSVSETDESDNTGYRSISVTAACSETDYWSPDSMSASETESGTTLEVEIQDAGSGGDLEFRVCKSSGTFSNDIHVDFEEWVRYSGYGIFSDDLGTSGDTCSSWETLSTSSWSDGDGFGGDIQIVSPDYCETTWGWSCYDGGSTCGTCWFISTSIMYRTCLE